MTKHSFWFWKHKLDSIFVMLSALVDYKIDVEEFDVLIEGIRGTNVESHYWFSYTIHGNSEELIVNLAYDDEDREIVHIVITAPERISREIKTLAIIQGLFSDLVLENR